MSFLTQTNSTIRRIHKNFTKELTVYNYEWDESAGTNEYADGDWIETVSTIDASVRLPESVRYSNDTSGNESNHDVEIYINPTEIELSTGKDDNTRATEFMDEQNRKYKAVGFKDESSLYRVQCREVQ